MVQFFDDKKICLKICLPFGVHALSQVMLNGESLNAPMPQHSLSQFRCLLSRLRKRGQLNVGHIIHTHRTGQSLLDFDRAQT